MLICKTLLKCVFFENFSSIYLVYYNNQYSDKDLSA